MRRMRVTVLSALVLTVLTCQNASAVIYSGSTDTGLQAWAEFQVIDSTLTVTLVNTGKDVLEPVDVLTGVFFSLKDSVPGLDLTPLSARLNENPVVTNEGEVLADVGQVVIGGVPFNPWWDADKLESTDYGNVGGEWGYRYIEDYPQEDPQYWPSPLPIYGISSTGLDIFGSGDFNGPMLDEPNALNGMSYGITSTDDDGTTGNLKVRSSAFINSAVVFQLQGFTANAVDLVDVRFQFGTDVEEPFIFVEGQEIPEAPPATVPEPATSLIWLVLGTTTIAGTAFRRRRRIR